jgi:hypothetical protein
MLLAYFEALSVPDDISSFDLERIWEEVSALFWQGIRR